MAGGIFVSYRRDDSRQAAGRLADDLVDHFGAERIFRDIEAIELGVDFSDALSRALNSCEVMLVLIGRDWLNVKDAHGQRRLDSSSDWIRLEIVTALKRNIRVVPVLVDGAELPSEDALPEDLRPLVRRQAMELADGRWKGDLQRLVDTLSRLFGTEAHPVPRPTPGPAPTPLPPPLPPRKGKGQLWAGIGIGALGLLVVAAMFAEDDAVEPVPAPAPFVPAPMPSPAPQPTPAPSPPPAAQLPNLGGMWRSADGTETYQFQQDGRMVQITAFSQGVHVGNGVGEVDGNLLRLNMNLQLQGVNLGNLNCNLQAQAGFRGFLGTCIGPNGQ